MEQPVVDARLGWLFETCFVADSKAAARRAEPAECVRTEARIDGRREQSRNFDRTTVKSPKHSLVDVTG
jgi:hypothetical protein